MFFGVRMSGQEIEGLPDIDNSWKINRSHLKIREEIGKGASAHNFSSNFKKGPLVRCTRQTSLV